MFWSHVFNQISAGDLHNNRKILIFVVIFVEFAISGLPTTRDKYLWPFASYSIWNLPIGSKATYVDAKLGNMTSYDFLF
jgi:hypothetical protein